jgi:hypothetical protein
MDIGPSTGLAWCDERREGLDMKGPESTLMKASAEAVRCSLARSGLRASITIMPFTIAPGLYEVRAISHASGHVFIVRGTDRRQAIRLAAQQAKGAGGCL